MTLRLWAILYLMGSFITVAMFELMRYNRTVIKYPTVFWIICAMFWPLMWLLILIIFILNREEEK